MSDMVTGMLKETRTKSITWHTKPIWKDGGFVAYEIENYKSPKGQYAKIRVSPTKIMYRFRGALDANWNRVGDVDGDYHKYDSLADFIAHVDNMTACPKCGELLHSE